MTSSFISSKYTPFTNPSHRTPAVIRSSHGENFIAGVSLMNIRKAEIRTLKPEILAHLFGFPQSQNSLQSTSWNQ